MKRTVRRLRSVFLAVFLICMALSIISMMRSRQEGRIVLRTPDGSAVQHYAITSSDGEQTDLPFEVTQAVPVPCGLELRLRVLKPFHGWFLLQYNGETSGGIEQVSLYAEKNMLFWVDTIPQGSEMLAVTMLLGQLFLTVYLLFRFHALEKETPYSYRLAAVGTGILFMLAVLGAGIAAAVQSYRETLSLTIDSIVYQITQTPFSVNRWLLPVLVIGSLAMLLSNIALIRHEGINPRHLLGAALGLFALLLMAAGTRLETNVLYPLADEDPPWFFFLYSLKLFFGSLLCYAECMAVCIVIYALKAARYEPPPDRAFIIIPGCAIRGDGTLYPLLRGRVDRALDFARKQEAQTGLQAVFIPSGGQGEDECVSEAEAMKRYLLSQGIDESRVLMEDRSSDTLENMRFSMELLKPEHADAKVAFSTTNYHVLRSGICASMAGLNALGMGSGTAWYFWPNAFARELIGLFVRQKKQHLLVSVLLLVISLLLAAALYVAVM